MAKPSIVFASILLTIIGATLFFVNLPWVASGAQTRTNNIVGTAFGAIFLAAGITGFWMLRNRQ
jgi:Ca2+/Na+ antiporter